MSGLGPKLFITVQGVHSRDLQSEYHKDTAGRSSIFLHWENQKILHTPILVSPTRNSGSANPFRPVAQSSGTVSLEGVVQGL